MSAITGLIYTGSEDAGEELRRQGIHMMNTLSKYPADDLSSWQHGPAFLGCMAQWVTPESCKEEMPYRQPGSRLTITADAIIDNRPEMFDRLGVEHSRRPSIGDGELILMAYAKWGEEALPLLVGDFAFVIWDEVRQVLFGARDMTGTRTLYYRQSHDYLAFSTVMEPLFSIEGSRKLLNRQWLAEFLAIRDMTDSDDIHQTVYHDIKQLPPSYFFRLKEGQLQLTRYATLGDVKELRLTTDHDYEEAFREVVQQAVDARLRTHKAVSVALSGGLDSGTVASYAARSLARQNKPLHALSYVPVPDFVDWTSHRLIADESPYIQMMVRHIGNIQENYHSFEERSPYSEIDPWLSSMEMPYKFFENSFWIRGFYEKAAELGAGALLTGSRGNFTISWGSAPDYYATLLKRMKWLRLSREMSLFSGYTNIPRSRLLKMITRIAFPSASGTPAARPGIPSLIHPDFARSTQVHERMNAAALAAPPRNAAEVRQYKFSNLAIANKNGTVAAKMSLTYGLPERDPTSDARVIRFCLSVPLEQYVRDGRDRALVRRATVQDLPDEIRLNQQRRGVQPADWLHRMLPAWPSFIQELEEMCRDDRTEQFLHMDALRKALEKARKPKAEYAFDPEIRMLMHSLIVHRFLQGVEA
ncbi:asparagine synthase-related protein [Paenibacillus sp. JX-17]|uniref:asparagine synthase (glutamine-hydrolyzing) n=1 Tax=Paenibacillus lacisoli TaxID=3064525 RepID=A0ABT9CD73_9BACL|nr:asparagine synthase-related protein [Paenibacillus sp. JX-17]MDO7907219.1 asparagine synthase-related protein [Paenibacillus sp. JX-17]